MVETVTARKRVPEHRIRISHASLVVRLWIEADPDFNGIESWADAYDAAMKALDVESTNEMDTHGLADHIAKNFGKGLSSVEVCDSMDNGCTIHLDWP